MAYERPSAETVTALVRRSEEANAALVRGDVDRYRALVPHTGDYTLMSPFGGAPVRGHEMTAERWDAMKTWFRGGTLRQELVEAYGAADIVVLAVIEHVHVEVGGLAAQDWPLRVTLVFRRDGETWRLAHRHADPLGRGIGLAEAAALARGEVGRAAA